jgi:hypothetical protein
MFEQIGKEFTGRVFAIDAQRHHPPGRSKMDGAEDDFKRFFHFYVKFRL